MKDMHSCLTAAIAIACATYAADSTPVVVDLQGYLAAELLLHVGVGGITFSGSNKIEIVLQHSDDGTTFTNVADADLLGVTGTSNGIVKALTSAHAAATVHRFGYKGGKRYLQAYADFSGTHGTGTPISAVILLGHGADNPQANQA